MNVYVHGMTCVLCRIHMNVYVHCMTCVLLRRHECLCTSYDVRFVEGT